MRQFNTEVHTLLINKVCRIKVPILCDRCGFNFKRGDAYRQINSGEEKWCASCIGFFLSRYSLTWDIPSPTDEELAYKEMWDREIVKLYDLFGDNPQQSPTYPQGMGTDAG